MATERDVVLEVRAVMSEMAQPTESNDQLTQNSFREGEDWLTTSSLRDKVAKRLGPKWNPSEEAFADIQKEDDFTGSPEEYIYHVLHKWAGSSGGPVIEVMISGVLPSMSPLLWWDEHQQMLHAFQDLGKLIYNETQTWLKHRGITEIKVLRSGGYEGRNYTSWSLNWGGARHAPNRKLHKKTFPASRVWSTPATGVGTLAESEIVILGK